MNMSINLASGVPVLEGVASGMSEDVSSKWVEKARLGEFYKVGYVAGGKYDLQEKFELYGHRVVFATLVTGNDLDGGNYAWMDKPERERAKKLANETRDKAVKRLEDAGFTRVPGFEEFYNMRHWSDSRSRCALYMKTW